MSNTRRIFVDTEWTAAPWSPDVELLWVGLADETGASWSAVNAGVDLENLAGSELVKLIPADEPRLSRSDIAAAVAEFCGDVNEFWAWIPAIERVAEWFGLGDEAADLYARFWDVDLQMLQSLVVPWPEGWPDQLYDLNAAATEAGADLPERSADHLNPRVHAQWNRRLFERIIQSRDD